MSEPQVNVTDCLQIDARAMSANEETRTVDVVWTTGERVLRYSVDGPFLEELEVSSRAIDTRRLEAGAPFLNGHRGGDDATKIIGNVVPGSVRIDGGKGTATVRFDTAENDPDAEKIFRKVIAGVVSGVSVGYRVLKMERTKEVVDGVPVYRVTKWEPYEISAAPMPADVGSKFRSLHTMSEKIEVSEAAPAEVRTAPAVQTLDAEAIRSQERARVSEIVTLARSLKFEDKADGLVSSGASISDARKALLDAVVERDAEQAKPRGVSVTSVRDAVDVARKGLTDALEYRVGLRGDVTEEARSYLGRSLIEMGRDYMRARNVDISGSRMAQAGALLSRSGMHSTSDFPLLLADVAGKSLRAAYSEAPVTFEPIVRRVTTPDFKQIKRIQLGDAPLLESVVEGAEIKLGSIGEGREVYSIATYAKRLAVTRQTLVNDDLDAFSRLPAAFGRAARDTEGNVVWSHFLSNPTMGDGVALFDAAHANQGTGAIDVDNVGAGRAAMRKQTGLNGSRLNLMPEYLIVPAAIETTADQFISTAMLANSDATKNPFAGRLRVISDARLDAVSAAIWYLAAGPGIDRIELATLEGENGPYIETREGFEIDGFEIKCRYDFGAKAIDHRGFYKSTGS